MSTSRSMRPVTGSRSTSRVNTTRAFGGGAGGGDITFRSKYGSSCSDESNTTLYATFVSPGKRSRSSMASSLHAAASNPIAVRTSASSAGCAMLTVALRPSFLPAVNHRRILLAPTLGERGKEPLWLRHRWHIEKRPACGSSASTLVLAFQDAGGRGPSVRVKYASPATSARCAQLSAAFQLGRGELDWAQVWQRPGRAKWWGSISKW